jgi:hypothetical protein
MLVQHDELIMGDVRMVMLGRWCQQQLLLTFHSAKTEKSQLPLPCFVSSGAWVSTCKNKVT